MKCAVLISLYNAQKTLDKTFESLQTQTFQDFRIVAINDCSKDTTLLLLQKWQGKFGKERFLIIDNQTNLGLTKSLNKGLSVINEPSTARIDADDWWHPQKIEKQIHYLESHPEYGLVGTWYENISLKKSKKITLPETDADIRKTIFKRNPFAHSAVLFRTVLVRNIGGYSENVYFGQDYDLWLRLLPLTKFHNLPEVLCYRNAEETLTSIKQKEQMLQCIKTQIKYIKKYHYPWTNYFYLLEPLLVFLLPKFIKDFKRKYI